MLTIEQWRVVIGMMEFKRDNSKDEDLINEAQNIIDVLHAISRIPPGYVIHMEGEVNGRPKYVVYGPDMLPCNVSYFAGRDKEPSIGWHDDLDNAVNEAVSYCLEREVDRLNDDRLEWDKIRGFLFLDQYYHAACIPANTIADVMGLEPVTLRSDGIENYICPHCDSPILDDEERDEFFDHPDHCECEVCMAVSLIAVNARSLGYIQGYTKGLTGYAEMRQMSVRDYCVNVQELTDPTWINEFCLGYEDAKGEKDAQD